MRRVRANSQRKTRSIDKTALSTSKDFSGVGTTTLLAYNQPNNDKVKQPSNDRVALTISKDSSVPFSSLVVDTANGSISELPIPQRMHSTCHSFASYHEDFQLHNYTNPPPPLQLWCTRSPCECVKLILFFIIFYGLLAAFFAAMLGLYMFAAIDENYPRLTGFNSALQLNPGVGIVPIPDWKTTLIHFRAGKPYTYRVYTDAIVAFTMWYEYHGMHKLQSKAIVLDCDEREDGNLGYNPDLYICHFDLNVGGRCNVHDDFGYKDGEPCFIVTLNRVFGFMPSPIYNETDIIIKCDGTEGTDSIAMGPICYYDSETLNKPRNYCKRDHGVIKNQFFPFVSQRNYRSPFVFVRMMAPKRGVVIRIECRAIARNIFVDAVRRLGSMSFEIIID